MSGGLQRVSYLNSSYDALAFPLYFPRGTATWHHGFKVPVVKTRGAKVDWCTIEMQQFYASMLYVRRSASEMPKERQSVDQDVRRYADGSAQRVVNDNTWFFRAGRLFQQFLCTAAARVELKRLSTLATPAMQKQLRAEAQRWARRAATRDEL